MTVEQYLQWAQLAVSVVTLLGGAFILGRLFERLSMLEDGFVELKRAIFGRDAQGGIFVRQTEFKLILEGLRDGQAHTEQKIVEMTSRIEAFEQRVMQRLSRLPE